MTSITISSNPSLRAEELRVLNAGILPSAALQNIVWTLEGDSEIAEINNNSILFGKIPGTVTVVATAADGSGVRAEQIFTITPIPVSSIRINSANSVEQGQTLDLAARIFPDDLNKTPIWRIIGGNNAIASINGNRLTALAVGEVIIEVIVDNGGVFARQNFRVTLPAPQNLQAVATGVPDEIRISWAGVNAADNYILYQTIDNLSAFANGNPDNLSAANPAATATEVGATDFTLTLNNTATHHFLVTAIANRNNGIESQTNSQPAAATAHSITFRTIDGGENQVWMDRNLGADRVAESSNDRQAFGDLYQWGRAADGHQSQPATATLTAIQASSLTPNHSDFITAAAEPNEWLAAGIDDNGLQRQAFWSRTDGSSICPTGFRVPIKAEWIAQKDVWNPQNAAGAFASNLKLPAADSRRRDGLLAANNSYWSSSVENTIGGSRDRFGSVSLSLFNASTGSSFGRVYGFSVRCIKN
ncbi:MAG: hypothetical protein HAW58_05060 [Candidatus Thioglobus sp.]|nr:hypothetical protein [Candidatus Thioglobus sp.]